MQPLIIPWGCANLIVCVPCHLHLWEVTDWAVFGVQAGPSVHMSVQLNAMLNAQSLILCIHCDWCEMFWKSLIFVTLISAFCVMKNLWRRVSDHKFWDWTPKTEIWPEVDWKCQEKHKIRFAQPNATDTRGYVYRYGVVTILRVDQVCTTIRNKQNARSNYFILSSSIL